MIGAYRGFDKRLKYLFDNATEVSFESTLASGTPIGSITIDGSEVVIYAPSGGGSSVSYTPIVNSGTKIGILTIDGTPHDVYAPEVTANPVDQATADLSRLKIGNTVYGVANPSDIQDLRTSFQAGVEEIYKACVRKGSTPASHSLSDVVDAIYNIGGHMGHADVESTMTMNMRYFGHAKEDE